MTMVFQLLTKRIIAVCKHAVTSSTAVLALLMLIGASSPVRASVFVGITAAPNWRLGNPQLVGVWAYSCLNANVCPAGTVATEDEVWLKLKGNPILYSEYDTELGLGAGVVGSDLSIPTAYWLHPAWYAWTDGGPTGGGDLLLFNSRSNGVAYANLLIVYDPPSIDSLLQSIDLSLGGNGVFPSSPTDVTSDLGIVPGMTSANLNVLPLIPSNGFAQAPEPSLTVLVGLLFVALIVIARRRQVRKLVP